MSSSAKILAALCGAALVSACSSGPEVVAVERTAAPTGDASPFSNLAAVHGCYPGLYVGQFSSAADAGFTLDGEFTFGLVQTLHVEFLSLADGAKLTGSSASSSVSFSATIRAVSGPCVDGAFRSTMEGGQFWVGGGGPLPFEGTVEGQYNLEFKSFFGSWNVLLNNSPSATTGGTWSATLKPNRP